MAVNVKKNANVYTIDGFDVIEKQVSAFGTGGAHVTLPVHWKNKKVAIVLME